MEVRCGYEERGTRDGGRFFPDGISRIFAYHAVAGSKLFGGVFYVAIGLPKASLLAVFNRFMVQNTFAIGVVALLGPDTK